MSLKKANTHHHDYQAAEAPSQEQQHEEEEHEHENLAGRAQRLVRERAISSYAQLRALQLSPFDERYERGCLDKKFKTLFKLDLVSSKVWTMRPMYDMYLFVRQAHPLFGFLAHKRHPLSFIDRLTIWICGVGLASTSSLFPGCELLCSDTCVTAVDSICTDQFLIQNITHNLTSNLSDGGAWCGIGTDCSDCGEVDMEDYRYYYQFGQQMNCYPRNSVLFVTLTILITLTELLYIYIYI